MRASKAFIGALLGPDQALGSFGRRN